MQIAVYARVSTDSTDQANSLENQKSYFERAASENARCQLYNIYADAGLTGTRLNNRPEFRKMLYDAGIDIIEVYGNKHDKRLSKKHVIFEVSDRQPAFSEIWIKNTSRFARNTLSFDIINKLRAKGVNIWFMEQNLNTKEIGSDLLLKLVQIFDEQDSRDKSIKVRTGIKEGARRGKINSNSKLFGYKYIQHENRLETIEDEAQVVRLIFSLYAGGKGIRQIINYLTDYKHFTRQGKTFGKTTISRILEQEKYAGINARLKYDTGEVFNKNSYAKVRPKSEWIVVETDKIPAIIDEELFYQCEAIRQGRVNYQNQVGVYKGISDHAGMIYCGICGATYNSNNDRGRRFYNCSTKKSHGTGACSSKNIGLRTLDRLLTGEMYYFAKGAAVQAGRTSLTALRKQLVEQLESTPTQRIKALESEISSIEGEEDLLTKAYMKRTVSEKGFERLNLPLMQAREKLVAELKSLTQPKVEVEGKIAEIDAALRRLDNMVLKEDTPRAEILADIKKIIVLPGNRLEIIFRRFIDEDKVKIDYTNFTLTYDE